MRAESITEIAYFYRKRFGIPVQDASLTVHPDTKFIIVIPCYNEPDLLTTLKSLQQCESRQYPVSVIVVINAGEGAKIEVIAQNEQTEKNVSEWIHENSNEWLSFHILHQKQLPAKHAGVGLARKIGMDVALYKFAEIAYNGWIVCLDADCTVEKNYLKILEKCFLEENPKSCTIYFEHDLKSVGDHQLRNGIVHYELFLRYYVNALRFSGFPFAFHTIGSSMGVRADVYAKTGGMNRRKAGEDFYFLHKVAPQGSLMEIIDTTIYPSARISTRVPFGTGKAQSEWTKRSGDEFYVYNPLIFKALKEFISSIQQMYDNTNDKAYFEWYRHLPEVIKAFLAKENFEAKLQEIRKNTSHEDSFKKRFFAWLDGFKVLKLVHFARDHFYPQVPIEKASSQLLQWLEDEEALLSVEELLMRYRNLDKKNNTVFKK